MKPLISKRARRGRQMVWLLAHCYFQHTKFLPKTLTFVLFLSAFCFERHDYLAWLPNSRLDEDRCYCWTSLRQICGCSTASDRFKQELSVQILKTLTDNHPSTSALVLYRRKSVRFATWQEDNFDIYVIVWLSQKWISRFRISMAFILHFSKPYIQD